MGKTTVTKYSGEQGKSQIMMLWISLLLAWGYYKMKRVI